MLIGCCHCGGSSSSSSGSGSGSRSQSASTGSGSGSGSGSSGSGSGSSGGYPTVPCEWCKDGYGPSGFEMHWNLVDNCPAPYGSGDVDCMDQNRGPHYGITQASTPVSLGSFRCPEPDITGCFWRNSSTGEVEVQTAFGNCGSCANGPLIVVNVKRTGSPGSYTYWMDCYVQNFFGCSIEVPGPPGFPGTAIGFNGYTFLKYSKSSSLPLNCMAENELELVCWD